MTLDLKILSENFFPKVKNKTRGKLNQIFFFQVAKRQIKKQIRLSITINFIPFVFITKERKEKNSWQQKKIFSCYSHIPKTILARTLFGPSSLDPRTDSCVGFPANGGGQHLNVIRTGTVELTWLSLPSIGSTDQMEDCPDPKSGISISSSAPTGKAFLEGFHKRSYLLLFSETK